MLGWDDCYTEPLPSGWDNDDNTEPSPSGWEDDDNTEQPPPPSGWGDDDNTEPPPPPPPSGWGDYDNTEPPSSGWGDHDNTEPPPSGWDGGNAEPYSSGWDSRDDGSSEPSPSGWDDDYRYEPYPLFKGVFRCLPMDKYKNPKLETGNKIIMPESSLSQLIDSDVRSPFFFKIRTINSDTVSHCGVLEFGAEEGFIHMPQWMMNSLKVEEGATVILSDAALSQGYYVKLQPHATAFVDLPDLKAVLETALRGFSCLSVGDTFTLRFNDKDFSLDVLEVRPAGAAISLIDTDCEVDFAPPLDYVEPAKVDRAEEIEEVVKPVFKAFTGAARRLDGKAVAKSSGCSVVPEKKKREEDGGKEDVEEFKPFTGKGRLLGGPSDFDL